MGFPDRERRHLGSRPRSLLRRRRARLGRAPPAGADGIHAERSSLGLRTNPGFQRELPGCGARCGLGCGAGHPEARGRVPDGRDGGRPAAGAAWEGFPVRAGLRSRSGARGHVQPDHHGGAGPVAPAGGGGAAPGGAPAAALAVVPPKGRSCIRQENPGRRESPPGQFCFRGTISCPRPRRLHGMDACRLPRSTGISSPSLRSVRVYSGSAVWRRSV